MTCRARLLLKLVYAVFPIPCFFSSACAGGYIELPLPFHISSVDVAADAISNLSFMPRFSTMSFKINSDIGERQMLPWQMNKILIFLIFPVFSGFSSLFTFLHFSLFLAYFGISLHIFVINFGKNFGKFQVCTKGKSAIGNRQVRNWGLRYILAFSHFSLIFIRSL